VTDAPEIAAGPGVAIAVTPGGAEVRAVVREGVLMVWIYPNDPSLGVAVRVDDKLTGTMGPQQPAGRHRKPGA
jgi:hypothetical protein